MAQAEITVDVVVNYSQIENLFTEYLDSLPRNVALNFYDSAQVELDYFMRWMRLKVETGIASTAAEYRSTMT